MPNAKQRAAASVLACFGLCGPFGCCWYFFGFGDQKGAPLNLSLVGYFNLFSYSVWVPRHDQHKHHKKERKKNRLSGWVTVKPWL